MVIDMAVRKNSDFENRFFDLLEHTLAELRKGFHELEFKLAANTIETKDVKKEVKLLGKRVDDIQTTLQKTTPVAPWYQDKKLMTIMLAIALLFMLIMAKVAGVEVPTGLL